ncbi:hypothetical protein KAR34_02515 [bacterium]|nr:hypothetical protein [bacterium]
METTIKKGTGHKPTDDDDSFVRHLKKATETVRSWPEWKQNLLGAATLEQRQKELSLEKTKSNS